jgi:hypothetical protein
MSIELDVKPRQVCVFELFENELAELLSSLFGTPRDGLAWEPLPPPQESLGDHDLSLTLRIESEDALVFLTCFYVDTGNRAQADNEGGWWFNVDGGYRTRPAFVLMMAVAVCLARLCQGFIVDEVGFFKKGRSVEPSDLLSILQRHSGDRLSNSANEICSALGVMVADQGD